MTREEEPKKDCKCCDGECNHDACCGKISENCKNNCKCHEDCKHERLHTEKMVREQRGETCDQSYVSVIVTFCADCGEKIKQVDIKSK